jgi:hypothetical protein
MMRAGSFRAGLRWLLMTLTVLGVALETTGCRRAHVAGTPSTDDVAKAFTEAGLGSEGLARMETPDVWSSEYCVEGSVIGLVVVVCEYQNDADLAVGEKKAYADWTSNTVDTGVVVHSGRTMLVVADRLKTDPSGRTIVRLLNAFRTVH